MAGMSKFSTAADQDNKAGHNQPTNEGGNDSNDDGFEDDDINDTEYEALDQQLDQLNSCLDVLEQQNDALKAELLHLLESSRQARREMQEEQQREKVNSQLDDNNLPHGDST